MNVSSKSSERADTFEAKPVATTSNRLTIDPAVLDRVNRALEEIRAGKMVVLVDDEDRENEGDLCMAADLVTAESINFMAKYGRGLICLALDEEQVARLELPMMAPPGRSGPPLGTAFTVSIEARHGVTTGISAADRAHTIRVATSRDAHPSDIVMPGHVFPLKARRGGVLVRTGQTEGSVDLARLSGRLPAGVICEIMNDDGTMARMPDLELFAKTHGILILTVADLIQYRLQTERLVKKTSEKPMRLDTTGTVWTAAVYEIIGEQRQFFALTKGNVRTDEPVLCRVHSGSVLADLFSSTPFDGGSNLREAIAAIEKAGAGVVLYIPPKGDLVAEIEALSKAQGAAKERVSGDDVGQRWTLREFGLGAQVLADLGVHKLRLLTNNQPKIAGLTGFGLEVVERVPLVSMKGAE
ncbi:MAG: 3,4-dihydroxy-2-butanone-4-phosphate synthase [Polyangiaceae bacterium]|nr:3,4-dihydroxy-2-butanone-4-phosphate synthase [Polyangiaceae bacterium]